MAAKLEVFCGTSAFWDPELTWNTTTPDFTACFQKTVLLWIPFGFLWMMAPLETYYLLKSTSRFIPWTGINVSKLVITSALAILALADLSYSVHRHVSWGWDVPSADYYAPFIKLVSFLLVIAFIVAGRLRGIISSGILFLFWLILVIASAFTYRSVIIQALDEDSVEDKFDFTINMIYYPLVVASFLLSCFADAKPYHRQFKPVSGEKECPEQFTSFLSKLLFSWFTKLAIVGWKRSLVYSDLWSLNHEDKTENVLPIFDKFWQEHLSKCQFLSRSAAYSRRKDDEVNFSHHDKKKNKPNIVVALCKTFGPFFMSGAVFKLIHDVLQFVTPKLLKLLIGFVSNNEPLWKGMFYAVLMFVATTIQSITLSVYFHRMYIVGMRIRTALISVIYRKALVMSNSARKELTMGEIVNLMSVDAQRFMDLMTFLNLLWSAPLQIILALVFLWDELGPSVLAGLGIMILMIPINGVIASHTKKLQVKQMKTKDKRVKMMNEILGGIKVLKLYAWEESFQKQVNDTRDKEVKDLKKIAYLNAVTSFLWSTAPFLVSLASFTVYVLVDPHNILDAQRAFVSITLFNILRFPMIMLPSLITMLVMASVSVTRMNKFVGSEELDPYVCHDDQEVDPIVIEHGTFTWSREEGPVLKDINLRIHQGMLVAVVGQVGAGKSSLLSALLGEMEKLEGLVNVKGSIAYVPQQAWIQNATVKDNILFAQPLNAKLYKEAIETCALCSDLDILPGGDLTEIGEKGINLSGGQKQRVSLARSVYSDADIYILDDPLSAVDSHVGKHIFEKVIGPQGVLKEKTRLLVTHSISFLSETDLIVVIKDGMILELGSYKELLEKKGAFGEFLLQYLQEDMDQVENFNPKELEAIEEIVSKVGSPELECQLSKIDSESGDIEQQRRERLRSLSQQLSISSSHSEHSAPSGNFSGSVNIKESISTSGKVMDGKMVDGQPIQSRDGTKLIQSETAETGEVKLSVYLTYFKSVGYLWVVAVVITYLAMQSFSVGSNIWLSAWSNDKPQEDGTQDTSQRNLRLGVYGTLGAGQGIAALLGSFFLSYGTMQASSLLHCQLLLNILRSPMQFFDTTPIGRIVNRFSKDIDTLDITIPMNLRSFLACFLQVLATLFVISLETPIFLVVILPMAVVYYLVQKFYIATSRQLKRLESITRSPIFSHFSETLAGVSTIRAYNAQERFVQESNARVDTNQSCYFPSTVSNRWLAIRLEFCGNCIVFFAALFAVLGRDTLSPGSVGLSVSYAVSITAVLNWMVRMSSELEANIVSVERLLEYTTTPNEAPWNVEDHKPQKSWPDKGVVIFKDYATRYREGLDLVLKGISCNMNEGEKVGIVGRTGAGKSSLTLSLFRIIEAAGGSISIDGVDISKIGLHDLRSKLTIIPQDPVLFSGTLRMNLDPFNKYSDEEIWRALEHSHLKSFVSGLEAGLEHEVAEGGENLSVGQRQLVCLARALLRKTKILVLDEATAAVDLETDDLIQATIRKEFSDCTVLTIAHRLNTIMDYTRVVVLDQGKIIEFDSPEALLKDNTTVFYSMAKDAGLV
ncbi:multidrug-Resistance like Protein 1 isoform X1 [Tachypleus tridentatus]|uniref:multidrug-Resistance like Protein 1 isoform X1 n=1 Tax=Tachypleus tridentatus TaxID=6853 RepID=UPI003FD3DA9C